MSVLVRFVWGALPPAFRRRRPFQMSDSHNREQYLLRLRRRSPFQRAVIYIQSDIALKRVPENLSWFTSVAGKKMRARNPLFAPA